MEDTRIRSSSRVTENKIPVEGFRGQRRMSRHSVFDGSGAFR